MYLIKEERCSSDGLLIFYGPVNVVELGGELRNSVKQKHFALFSMGGPQGSLTPRSEHIVFYISIDTALCMPLFYFIE